MKFGWMLLALAMMGCGASAPAGPGGAGDAGAAGNPLVGTWAMTACTSFSEAVAPCEMALIFEADGGYTNRVQYVKDPSSTTGFRGCTITAAASGYRWTAAGGVLNVVAVTPRFVVTRTNCMDPSDNQPTPTMPDDFTPGSFTLTNQSYTIQGNTLLAGGPGGTALMRR